MHSFTTAEKTKLFVKDLISKYNQNFGKLWLLTFIEKSVNAKLFLAQCSSICSGFWRQSRSQGRLLKNNSAKKTEVT